MLPAALRAITVTLLLASMHAFVATARADDAPRPPFQRDLELVYIFEGDKPEFLFVIGSSGFRTVEALQQHLDTWPPGSELRWAPGCSRFGGEPLLSSEKDMEAFRAFLLERDIRFVLVPSG